MDNLRDISVLMGVFISLVLISCLCYKLTGTAGVVLLLLWLKDLINPSRLGGGHGPGVFEIQVLRHESGTREGLREWQQCNKNPHHHGFIPVSEFKVQDLPKDYQTEDWFLFIKAVAEVTVRLRVYEVSPNRPKTGPYALELGGNFHSGTGFIGGLRICDDPCPCNECSKTDNTNIKPSNNCTEAGLCSARPCTDCSNGAYSQSSSRSDHSVRKISQCGCSVRGKIWGRLMITTAAHVVYDEHEAKATYVDIFYNDEAAKEDGRMKTVRGYGLKGASDNVDVCVFYCAFHDDDYLAQLIRQKRSDVVTGWRRTRDIILKTRAFKPPTNAVLVSHPHSQAKKITFGDIKKLSRLRPVEEECEYVWQMFECEYTADSCPGSSGGNIIWLGDLRLGEIDAGWWFGTHSKSREDANLNVGTHVCIKRNSSFFWRGNPERYIDVKTENAES